MSNIKVVQLKVRGLETICTISTIIVISVFTALHLFSYSLTQCTCLFVCMKTNAGEASLVPGVQRILMLLWLVCLRSQMPCWQLSGVYRRVEPSNKEVLLGFSLSCEMRFSKTNDLHVSSLLMSFNVCPVVLLMHCQNHFKMGSGPLWSEWNVN